MSTKYKFADNDKIYFISFAVVYWIDLFIRKEYKQIVIDSWKYCQLRKDLEIYGWCIMTSHVHMIIGSRGRTLDKTVGEMKSFTSTNLKDAIKKHTGESRKEWMIWIACPGKPSGMERAGRKNGNNRNWQLWQQHNKPLEILNDKMFYQKLDYIHYNPVKAGFVDKEEEYLFSSARDFYDRKGLIELSYIV